MRYNCYYTPVCCDLSEMLHSEFLIICFLDYLCNIFEAVEVNPSNDLKTIKELLMVESEKYVFVENTTLFIYILSLVNVRIIIDISL